MKAIINATAILPNSQGQFCAVEKMALLYDEKLEQVLPMSEYDKLQDAAAEVIDAAGNYVAPGFINLHIHGCMGYDAMDDVSEALPAMQKFLASTGVTSFYPTTMTYDFPSIYCALERVRQAMQQAEVAVAEGRGARVLGAHMEGPFINPLCKGAQAETNIMKADFAKLEPYLDVVKLITIAPEMLEGDYRFLEQCREAGIVLSCGHSAPDYETAVDVIENHGVGHITHLFNGMQPFHHRKPGLVGAALNTDVNCEIIADNVHSHPGTQRLLYNAKGGKHIILITDSMRACGLGDGESELGGQRVFVKGNLATLDDGTIAGSVLRMNNAVKIFAENTGASLPEVIAMATQTPAQELGLYDLLGSLEVGKEADLVVLNKELTVLATVVSGKMVYKF